ncbi:MAG: hypothetical protein HY711_11790 [Candidatus Melainabacteria bacterium]|nr:hypothetical protein [Candidatus Melainabacteria bacterium]
MGRKRDLSASGERSVYFTRARWKHWIRYFAVSIIVLLNIGLLLSNIQLFQEGRPFELRQVVFSLFLAIFFDLTVLVPTMLEVDKLWATPDKVILKTLFWTSKIPWDHIRQFHNPLYLTFAILRTPRCCYFLNKRDLQPADELIETIKFKLAKVAK